MRITLVDEEGTEHTTTPNDFFACPAKGDVIMFHVPGVVTPKHWRVTDRVFHYNHENDGVKLAVFCHVTTHPGQI